MYFLGIIGLVLIGLHGTVCDILPTCTAGDFHYEYTECDSEGGRWRVSVPKPNTCVGGLPNSPVRGPHCGYTCDEGEYLDIQGDQECLKCPNGTYSLGGGERFDDWDKIPIGFSATSEGFTGHLKYTYGHTIKLPGGSSTNCNGSSWTPRGNYIAAMATDCSAVLTYSTSLVKPGKLQFEYQYTDDDAIFHFLVQNDQCQTIGDRNSNRWPSQTDEGEWKKISVDLKSGLNLLTWKAMGVGGSKSAMRKPILIRTIEITGVAFTSQCTKCKEGTVSGIGASSCKPCGKNFFSKKGDLQCTPCKPDQYSELGSGECKTRPPCSVDDYYEYNSPCDEFNKTSLMYAWIEPKICRPELPESVKLPEPGVKEPCPPCNPGMELLNGTCHFCPPNTYSDGNLRCQQCPASTAPKYGLEYRWWTSLPPEANISSSCLSTNERGCATKTGWQMAMDHIHSGRGHTDDVYLVLVLKVGGFRGTEQVLKGKAAPVGKISFVFELECTSECTLFFMQQSQSRGTAVIDTWTGKTEKKQYMYELTKTEPVVFSWAFQKADWDDDTDGSHEYNYKNDIAKIFSISVENTVDGAAHECQLCPKGSSVDGCIPCPAGHYIDPNNTQCMKCPQNTIVHGANPWGREACLECGEGLNTTDQVQCSTNCQFTTEDGKMYDFRELGSPTVVSGTRLFTASGTQYYHTFNISLCGSGSGFSSVMCHDNISYGLGREDKNDQKDNSGTHHGSKKSDDSKRRKRSHKRNNGQNLAENDTDTTDEDIHQMLTKPNRAEEVPEFVSSLICRTTMIPPKPNEEEGVLAAQPVSLGDILVNITSNHSSLNMDQRMIDEGYSLEDSALDVHFTYLSEEPTSACRKGRSTVITLRCDASQTGTGVIDLPPKCSDGTCDGCNFHFLWRTRVACPVCKEADYEMVIGECKEGIQMIHYYPPKHCVLTSGTKPLTKTRQCSVLPFWLQIAIISIVATGILMCILVIYCWKKNKKLEYKYMKLVHSGTSSKDGELPAAETCALDEGEDEEQFDAVEFKESKGKKLFNKLKSMANKKDVDNPFETIQLNEKMPLT